MPTTKWAVVMVQWVVGRAVAYASRGWQFESSHRQNVNYQLY